MNNNGIYYIAALQNIMITICFTIVAIYFNRWWIILFSSLCYSSVKNVERKE